MKAKLTVKTTDGEQVRVSFSFKSMKMDAGRRGSSVTFNDVTDEEPEEFGRVCFYQTDLFGDKFVIIMVKDISSMTVIN